MLTLAYDNTRRERRVRLGCCFIWRSQPESMCHLFLVLCPGYSRLYSRLSRPPIIMLTSYSTLNNA